MISTLTQSDAEKDLLVLKKKNIYYTYITGHAISANEPGCYLKPCKLSTRVHFSHLNY